MEVGQKRRILAYLSCGLFALIAPGCGVKFVPAPTPGAELTGKGWARIEAGGIGLAARQGRLEFCPAGKRQLIIPFEVRVENKTPEPVSISPENFVLQGSDQRQYQLIDPREQGEAGGERRGRVRPFWGLGLAWGWAADSESVSWGFGFPVWSSDLVASERCREEIYLKALQPGVIEPGAYLQGLLLFRGDPGREQELRLKLKKTGAGEENRELFFRVE